MTFPAYFAAGLLLALSASALAGGPPPTTLPTMEVPGNRCSVIDCTGAPYVGATPFPMPGPVLPTDAAQLPARTNPDKMPTLTCKQVADIAKANGCDTANPPSVPSIPSASQGAWVSNGCGTGAIKERVAVSVISKAAKVPYTGDMTNPLPGVSFAGPCAAHDKCYYTDAKRDCDDRFWYELRGICDGVGGTPDCMLFASAYADAVKGYGQDAYDEDHAAQRCAQLAKDIKDQKNCVDSAVGPA